MKPLLTKTDFVKRINYLKEKDESQQKINEVFSTEFEDCYFFPFDNMISEIVDLLEVIFTDTENRWISYWVYDLEYGKNYEDGSVTEADGSIIKLATAEDLYNFLVKEYFSE